TCTVGSGWTYTITAADNCGTVSTTRGDTGGNVSPGPPVDPTLTNVTLTSTHPSRQTPPAACPAPPLGKGKNRTRGFLGSKEATITSSGTSSDLSFLGRLNLKTASGEDFDPGSVSAFQTWLNAAAATNMAYMLSAQLAAMELNVIQTHRDDATGLLVTQDPN